MHGTEQTITFEPRWLGNWREISFTQVTDLHECLSWHCDLRRGWAVASLSGHQFHQFYWENCTLQQASRRDGTREGHGFSRAETRPLISVIPSEREP